MGDEPGKVLAVVRHAVRLVHVEPGQSVDTGFYHARLCQIGDEAARYDVVCQQGGVQAGVEHQRTPGFRHLRLVACFTDFQHGLIGKILRRGYIGSRCKLILLDGAENVREYVYGELLGGGGHELFQQGDCRGGSFLGGHVNGLELVLVEHHRNGACLAVNVLHIVAIEVGGRRRCAYHRDFDRIALVGRGRSEVGGEDGKRHQLGHPRHESRLCDAYVLKVCECISHNGEFWVRGCCKVRLVRYRSGSAGKRSVLPGL